MQISSGDRLRLLALALFLFTGFSGLIYEVLWTRMFSLVLGTTTFAVATVLGTYMGGLALGSWWFGRIADRPKTNGLRLYGWLELAVGLYAFLLPTIIGISNEVYIALWPSVEGSLVGQIALRVTLVAITLFLPTVLMGGSLPALSRYLVRDHIVSGRSVGMLYGLNTLGAVFGCFLTGFFFMEAMGIRASLFMAGGINLIVSVVALRAAGRSPNKTELELPKPHADAPTTGQVYDVGQVRAVLAAFAISGFAALALEVLWTRALIYFVNIDSWAFTAMLTAFLCGIGLGSVLMSRFADRVKNPLLWFAGIEIAIGISAALSLPLFGLLYETFGWIDDGDLAGGDLLRRHIVYKLGQSFLIMIVPTLLMGAAFPLVGRIYVARRGAVGQAMGTLYALNTMGAIVGSLAAGFALIPLFGVHRSILIVSSLYILIGLWVMFRGVTEAKRSTVRTAGITVAIALIAGNVMYSSGTLIEDSHWFKRSGFANRFKTLFYEEAPAATVSVLEKDIGTRELNINGKSTAFDNYLDMQVHRMLSHLPLLLHPDPNNCLVVGFGMGSTVYGCSQHALDRLDVVELLSTERRTAVYFEHINHGVIDDPKVNFIVGDGRNYILATRERYDVISFNAIHPRYSANLYTYEFYVLCRQRLTDDGIVCAWMTQNSLTHSEWLMICRSLSAAFEYTSLWYCNPEHFCLLGSNQPIRIHLDRWKKVMASQGIRDDLRESNLEDPYWLASRFLMGDGDVRDYLADGPMNTDDRPHVEFSREREAEERLVIQRLIARKVSAGTILAEGSYAAEDKQALERYERATHEYMLGGAEFWYGTEPMLDRVHMRKALAILPLGEDIREQLEFSRDLKSRTEASATKNSIGSQLTLAYIALQGGDLTAARSTVGGILQQQPNHAVALALLGIIDYLNGRYESALNALKPALVGLGRVKGKPPTLIRIHSFTVLAANACQNQLGKPDPALTNVKAQVLRSLPRAEELFTLFSENVRLMQSMPR